MYNKLISAMGIALREEFMYEIESSTLNPSWLEIIAENWIQIPKKHIKIFENLISKYPIMCHGVGLSIASDKTQINTAFIRQIKTFLDRYGFENYSEHISFSNYDGIQTHELLPPPFNTQSINTIVDNIDYVQNILQREIILENTAWYYLMDNQIKESEFLNEISKRSGAKILLDLNNIFVNSQNHNFDAKNMIDEVDLCNVAYYHIAGHTKLQDGTLIDSHDRRVSKKVIELMKYTLSKHYAPLLLERDANIPPIEVLSKEFNAIKNEYEAINE